jgi:hypothetical protein
MAKRRCKGTTKAGKRCQAPPPTGEEFCRAHSPLLPAEARFGSPEQAAQAGALGGAAGRRPRVVEVLRERLESDIDRWLAPLEAALGEGKPIQMWDGQERKHTIQYVPDPALGMKALKLALDRVYGRPRQEVEVSGAGGGAVEFEITNPEVREAMHGLVRAVAAARES